MDIDAVVQEKIDNDSDFQSHLATIEENERDIVIEEKRKELIKNEFEALDKKARENEQKFNDQKIRAEKAEILAKQGKQQNKGNEGTSNLGSKDIIALTKANIADEDIDEVIEYAQFKKISVSEALKSNVIKASLAEKEEVRRSASASNTGGAGRGSSKVSVERLMDDANRGKLPEKDDDIQRLLLAKMKNK